MPSHDGGLQRSAQTSGDRRQGKIEGARQCCCDGKWFDPVAQTLAAVDVRWRRRNGEMNGGKRSDGKWVFPQPTEIISFLYVLLVVCKTS
jgi:hypothetical protein